MWLAAWTLLAISALQELEVEPPADPRPGASDRADSAELPADFLRWIREVAELQTRGELDRARLHFADLFESEVYADLTRAPDSVALEALTVLDARADILGLLPLQHTARAETARRLRESLDPDHLDLLTAEENLGVTKARLGDFQGARVLFERVHSARERLLAGDAPELLQTKQNLAAMLKGTGDLAGALALEEHVHAVRERVLPADHSDLLAAKYNLGQTRGALGDLAGALELQEHVHAAYERLLPADDPDLLTVELGLAHTRREIGDLEGALVLLEHVHAAYEGLLPDNHPRMLVAKESLAESRRRVGDREGAAVLFRQVLAAREGVLPAEDPALLRARFNLALITFELGDVAAAQAVFEHVHTARERLLPPGHPDLLESKLALAAARNAHGDLEGALALEEHVLAARTRRLPADHRDLLHVEQNLAVTRRALGDLAGARELEEHVLAVRERTLPENHPALLQARGNLAVTLYVLGDFGGALELFEQVAAAWARTFPAGHPDLLDARHNVAATRKALGDLAGALELEELVHAELERTLPADHPDLLATRWNLASTRRALGDVAGGLRLAQAIVEALPSFLLRAGAASPRDRRVRARRALHELAKARIWRDTGDPELERAAFEVLESARFLVAGPLRGRLDALDTLDTLDGEDVEEIRDRLRSAEAEIERLVSDGPAPAVDGHEESARAWRAAIQAAALRRDQAQEELLGRLGGDLLERVTKDRVAATLEPRSAAVGVTRLRNWTWGGESEMTLDGSHYVAQVVSAGGDLREVDLGRADRLEELVAAWRRGIGAPASSDTRGGSDGRGVGVSAEQVVGELETGRALRRALLDPVLAEIGADETVHLFLDGALFAVPVDALPLDDGTPVGDGPAGDAPRIGDRYRVRYASSMADLVDPRADPDGPPTVLAVGDVAFDSVEGGRPEDAAPLPASVLEAAGGRSSGWGAWSELPATSAELDALASRAEELLGTEAAVLRRETVTHARLAAAVRGKRYVHLATHGWFMPETVKSILDDEAGRDWTLLGARETITGFAPFELCGLVLSGANSVEREADRSSRLLTARELAAFDLTSCELAVLSACETNVGVARAGQGIQSLQAALHTAGARASITSLWRIPDEATAELMAGFYENLWRGGMGKADALWKAKSSLRASGHPVREWAAWVLSGDPR